MSQRAKKPGNEVVQPARTSKTLVSKPTSNTDVVVASKTSPASKTVETGAREATNPTAHKTTGKASTSKTTSSKRTPAKSATAKSTDTTSAASKVAAKPAQKAPAIKRMTAPKTTPAAKATGKAKSTSIKTPMKRATPTGPEAPEATIGTDAAFANEAPATTQHQIVRNISEVRHFFRTNNVPIFFIGATPFNLLGLDRWVRNFSYISYYDGWDGAHPRVFTPSFKPYVEFESGEDINNWLLLNPEVRARMTQDLRPGVKPKVAMVFFNEETERICRELGYDLILPSAELRNRLDSKIVTTKLGNDSGVPSVPNTLSKGTSYKALLADARKAKLGEDLVVQTPYGDSGKTTFFIASEADWETHAEDIVDQEIKIMRRINNLPVAVEAVLTRSGTLVGPFLTELAGHEELTPYPGGWCGNEMHPEVLSTS